VLLHVYDVSHSPGVQWLNTLMANNWSPLKLGGAFHVGVEVYGREWMYGHNPDGAGIVAIKPLSIRHHRFRETIPMASTELSKHEVSSVVQNMHGDFSGLAYHILSKNCCHFAQEFCTKLGVGSIPEWLCRLASIGDSAVQTMQSAWDQSGLPNFGNGLVELPRFGFGQNAKAICNHSTSHGPISKAGCKVREVVLNAEAMPKATEWNMFASLATDEAGDAYEMAALLSDSDDSFLVRDSSHGCGL